MILNIFFIIVNLEVVSGRGLVHKVIIIIVDIEEVCYRPLDLASKTLRGNRIFLLDLQEQTLSIIQILAYYQLVQYNHREYSHYNKFEHFLNENGNVPFRPSQNK